MDFNDPIEIRTRTTVGFRIVVALREESIFADRRVFFYCKPCKLLVNDEHWRSSFTSDKAGL